MVCVRKCQVLMMAMTMTMMFNLVRLMRMLMTAMIMMTMKDIDLSKKIKPPDFQANNFTPLFLPNFNSFGDEATKKVSENGEIYTAGKNFTLPPAVTAVTAVTNLTSGRRCSIWSG